MSRKFIPVPPGRIDRDLAIRLQRLLRSPYVHGVLALYHHQPADLTTVMASVRQLQIDTTLAEVYCAPPFPRPLPACQYSWLIRNRFPDLSPQEFARMEVSGLFPPKRRSLLLIPDGDPLQALPTASFESFVASLGENSTRWGNYCTILMTQDLSLYKTTLRTNGGAKIMPIRVTDALLAHRFRT